MDHQPLWAVEIVDLDDPDNLAPILGAFDELSRVKDTLDKAFPPEKSISESIWEDVTHKPEGSIGRWRRKFQQLGGNRLVLWIEMVSHNQLAEEGVKFWQGV